MRRDKKSVPKANDAKGTPCIFLFPYDNQYRPIATIALLRVRVGE